MLAGFDFTILPHVDAALNAIATVLIVVGLIAIKLRREGVHKFCMLAATSVSVAFLACYLIYHLSAEPMEYTGPMRGLYLAILLSHILLAVVQLPLILLTLRAALRDDRPRHRRLAKWTAPIWLYTSITGVVVYVFLYRLQ